MSHAIYPQHRRSHKQLIWIVWLAVMLVIIGSAYLLSQNYSHLSVSQASHLTPTSPTSSIKTVDGSYLFSGTIVLARGVESYADGNYSQPFSGMATLGNYDAHIGVLECPYTTNADSFQNEVQNLVFNCQPVWLPYLKQNFPILNLSSDHLNDQGPQGINNTFKLLNADGFQTVGTYDPHSLTDDCKAIILPVRLLSGSAPVQNASIPIAMCSYNYKYLFQPQPGEIASIKKWSQIMPVIALLNEGPEYHHTAGAQQVQYAHAMIDNGADMVIGNGTHWVQNTEVYKGKLIVYSMGNFIFDQLDQDGRIALNLAVNMQLNYNSNVARWISLSVTCLANNETCYSLALSRGLDKITPYYSFNAIASYGGYLQVATRANASQQAYMEQRANWVQTMSELPKNY